jgi:hypothetical protein
MASDYISKNLIIYNKHLRLVGQLKVKDMIINFPYVKCIKNRLKFLTEVENMRYCILGLNNGYLINKFVVHKDPYDLGNIG